MCEFSGKLVAWMDGELEANDSAAVKHHLESCAECRGCVEAYQHVSHDIGVYCDAALASGVREWPLRSVAAASATGAIAALLGLFLLWPRMHAQPRELHPPQALAVNSPAAAENSIVAPLRLIEKVRRRPVSNREGDPAQNRPRHLSATQTNIAAYTLPSAGVVEIAIPADEMFPPGAVPEGMHFVADMTIAADGSAERLQVRPRLAGFERSTVQP